MAKASKAQPATPVTKSKHDQTVHVLQGGGALGAYQAGVYEALACTCYRPDWVAGVSIGAINAALIAGNPPERRIERLSEFWHLVSNGMGLPNNPSETYPWLKLLSKQHRSRSAFNQFSASWSALLGIPGFYKPRFPPAWLQFNGAPSVLSIYDTAPLRTTLEDLIDFDLINSKKVRLSVGAVNVVTGNSEYFDNFARTIGPEHIMASGALPPAFAPVEIDGNVYWDGGIVSNTPLQYVLDTHRKTSLLVFQVDLFNARGALPINLAEVQQRQKDILYSSRTRFNSNMAAEVAIRARRFATY
ncbi:patatin-like phospholipase family protein [Chitinimonas sp. BJB300]|uniref:patatin-like phospholipase family protein n=1 Tax=Chitinimonas sp. BJB300 TaxID=1559339 RepID=UPI00269692AD|nr:patatin-like phospholipase family protein [Chitinimonas sp. BJB300]